MQVPAPSRQGEASSHITQGVRFILVLGLLIAGLVLLQAQARSAAAFEPARPSLQGCGLPTVSSEPCPADPTPPSTPSVPSVVTLSEFEARSEAGTQAIYILEFTVLWVLNVGLLILFHQERRRNLKP